jgi:hypothetical protein
MKKNLIWLAGIAVMLTACENSSTEYEDSYNQEQGQKTIVFNCEGDFGNATFTRAALEADGKAMTDLWVLDYVGGTLVQQVHQVSTDEDFGTPTLNLDYGSHHVYFVASRGEGATLSTEEHNIAWAKPLDTFYKDFQITVSAGTSSAHNVTLERVVTRLRVTVADEIPAGIASITVTPTTWYYGIDYLTGGPAAAQASAPRTIAIPDSKVGTTGQTNVSIYGFSSATEWTTDVSVVARNSSSDVIGTANITDAPFKANRSTNYTGNLFVNAGGFALALSGEWDTEFAGNW